eukprot:366256-Chlamydomonas_euryale.AAC.11
MPAHHQLPLPPDTHTLLLLRWLWERKKVLLPNHSHCAEHHGSGVSACQQHSPATCRTLTGGDGSTRGTRIHGAHSTERESVERFVSGLHTFTSSGVVEGSTNRGRKALFHQQRGVAVARGRNGREVNIFVLNMPRSACGHSRLLSVEPITAGFVVSRRSNGDTDGRRHGPHERRRALVACCLALVGRQATDSGRNAAAVPAMPACMPAARGRKRRHTVAAPALDGEARSRHERGSSEPRFVCPVE